MVKIVLDVRYWRQERDKMITEYGTFNVDEMSKTTVLDTGIAFNGSELTLVAISEGWACAGSCARWDSAGYATRFTVDGARHGRKFKTLAEARALFDKQDKS